MLAKGIYRIFYILIGLIGLSIQLGIFSGTFYISSLNYYTILSNILCVVYFSFRLYYDYTKAPHTPFRRFVMSRLTKYCVTMCITLTFLVYHFLLASAWHSDSTGLNLSYIGNYIVHYIIPVMTILDFFIFDRKRENIRWSAPFVWMIVPLAYFVFILLRAPIFGNIGNTSSPYPYNFIDFTIQPVGSVITNVLLLIVSFVIIGYIFLLIDYGIGKLAK